MNTPFTPETIIEPAVIDLLRQESAAAEQAGTQTDAQLAVIYRKGWFKAFVPKTLGGMELSLVDGLRLEEALAWVDGSLGWTVTLCSGATMFVGYLDQKVTAEIFKDPAVCFGGSGRPSGVATIAEGGYIVKGTWKYATGAPHLTVFTANCVVERDGVPILDKDGEPVVRSFYFLRDEVEIVEDWQTMGLKATAGHSFAVKGLWVPESRSFIISGDAVTLDHPVYRFPFLPFAEATLAVNTLGMTLRFLDLCGELFDGRRPKYEVAVAELLDGKLEAGRDKVMELRTQLYDVMDWSWTELLENGMAGTDALEDIGRVCRELVVECRQLVLLLYPYCGMAGADEGSEINRVWRDLFTASQHSLLTYGG